MRVLTWALDSWRTPAGKIISVILSLALIFSMSNVLLYSSKAYAEGSDGETEEPFGSAPEDQMDIPAVAANAVNEFSPETMDFQIFDPVNGSDEDSNVVTHEESTPPNDEPKSIDELVAQIEKEHNPSGGVVYATIDSSKKTLNFKDIHAGANGSGHKLEPIVGANLIDSGFLITVENANSCDATLTTDSLYGNGTIIILNSAQGKGVVQIIVITVNLPEEDLGYTVTYDLQGGQTTSDTTTFSKCKKDSNTPTIVDPTREGYVFKGWTPEVTPTVTSSITYVAQWEAEAPKTADYKIVFLFETLEKDEYGNSVFVENKAYEAIAKTADVGAEVSVSQDECPSVAGYEIKSEDLLRTEIVASDGTTEIHVNYWLSSYDVTYTYTSIIPANAPVVPNGSTYKYTEEVSIAGAPTLAGYTFSGWVPKTGPNASEVADGKFSMPSNDVEFEGSWTANTDTSYIVEFYYQKQGSYTVTPEKDERQATTDAPVNVTEEDKVALREGYVLDESAGNVISGIVAGDGSLTLKLYFKQQFIVTYDLKGGTTTDEKISYSNLDYGTKTPRIANPEKPGYNFIGWGSKPIADTVTETVTYTAQWEGKNDTPYTIKFFYQANGSYDDEKYEFVTQAGLTDSPIALNPEQQKPSEGYAFDDKADNVLTGTIAPDGSTVLKVYFKQQFTVAYLPGDHGTFDIESTGSLDWNATTPPVTAGVAEAHDAGYTFAGWSVDGEIVDVASTVQKNVAYTAKWTPNQNTPYEVEFYYQDTDKNYPTRAKYTSERTGTTDALASVTDADKVAPAGYAYDEEAANVLEKSIAGDGTTTLKVYFKILSYKVTYQKDRYAPEDAVVPDTQYDVVFGSTVTKAIPASVPGYIFLGWESEEIEGNDDSFTMPACDVVLTGSWERDTSGFEAVGIERTYTGLSYSPTVRFSDSNPQRSDEIIAWYDGIQWNQDMVSYTDVKLDESGQVVGYPVMMGIISAVGGKLIWAADDPVYVTIKQRPVTLEVADKEMTYQGQEPVYSGKPTPGTGLIKYTDLGEITYFFDMEGKTVADLAVGVYENAINVNYTENTNYDVTIKKGTLEVLPADANGVNVENMTSVYDGDAHSISATALVVGSQIQYSIDGEQWDTEKPTFTDVGTYVVYARAVADNFKTTEAKAGTVVIDPRPAFIIVNDATKVAGTVDPSFDGQIDNLVNADDLGTVSFYRTSTTEGVGVYNGVLTASYEANINYIVTIINGNFTITPAAVLAGVGPVAPAPPAAPAAPIAPAAPAAPVTTIINDDATPMAEAAQDTIEDEEVPMAAFDEPVCWVHIWMIIGIIITLVYGLFVVARRLGYASEIEKMDKNITGSQRKTQTATHRREQVQGA